MWIDFQKVGQHADRLEFRRLALFGSREQALDGFGGVAVVLNDLFERVPARFQPRIFAAQSVEHPAGFTQCLAVMLQIFLHAPALVNKNHVFRFLLLPSLRQLRLCARDSRKVIFRPLLFVPGSGTLPFR